MTKLRCPEYIQWKSIWEISPDSGRSGAFVIFYTNSSKFVSIRHSSARYAEAWAKRNTRHFVNQKKGYAWGIFVTREIVINAKRVAFFGVGKMPFKSFLTTMPSADLFLSFLGGISHLFMKNESPSPSAELLQLSDDEALSMSRAQGEVSRKMDWYI